METCLDYRPDEEQQAKVLLLWMKRWQPILRLSTNVLREICSYLYNRTRILGIFGRQIAVFDTTKQSFQFASLSMEIPETCVFSELTAKSIILLGFRNKSVHSLSFPDLKFTSLTDMSDERSYPGIIRCDSLIYIFGGESSTSTSLVSCERYSASTELWQTLPDMHSPKARFCPVRWKQRVFLPALGTQVALESLHLESLSITIHRKLPDSYYVSVAALAGDDIVILTYEKVYRVSLDEQLRDREQELVGFSGVMITRSTPLVIGRVVWLMLTAKLTAIRYHIDEQQLIEFKNCRT